MSTIGKVKKLIPSSRSRTRISSSLTDIRETRTVARTEDITPMTSTSSSPPPSQIPNMNNHVDCLNTLKIPDAIRFLPTYDDNSKTLS